MTVAQDGSGDYISLQQAIDACKAFPDHRITIFVKNGIYKEKLVVPSCNTQLSIVGESTDKTIITFDDYFDKINRGRNSTFYTYTLKVEADDFRLESITVENSAGPLGQAGAFPLINISGARTGNTILKNAGITNSDKQLVVEKEVPENVVQVLK